MYIRLYNCEYYKFLDKVYITLIYKDLIGNKYFYKLEDKFKFEYILHLCTFKTPTF
jgi:hypothetical protein